MRSKRLARERSMSPQEVDRLVRRIRAAQQRLGPLLPDIDPGDLGLILERIFRLPGSGRSFFIRPNGRGGYVF